MQVGFNIVVDLDTGDYDVKVNNLSEPGEPMEWSKVKRALDAVLGDFHNTKDQLLVEQ